MPFEGQNYEKRILTTPILIESQRLQKNFLNTWDFAVERLRMRVFVLFFLRPHLFHF